MPYEILRDSIALEQAGDAIRFHLSVFGAEKLALSLTRHCAVWTRGRAATCWTSSTPTACASASAPSLT